ncbi:MAG: DUF177 domain-containing protein [Victivallaceae bacterium]|nr:DUF177 domain-containing protein [Victivallaceae bacterium]
MIKFSTARLDKEPIELEGFEPAEFLEVEPSDTLTVAAPVEYKLLARQVSGGALVTGRVSTVLAGECGRCLAPVRQDCAVEELSLYFDIAPGVEELDISDDVRVEMTLALPMTLLCSPDCKGLCPVCGADRNQGECGCSLEKPSNPAWGELDKLNL